MWKIIGNNGVGFFLTLSLSLLSLYFVCVCISFGVFFVVFFFFLFCYVLFCFLLFFFAFLLSLVFYFPCPPFYLFFWVSILCIISLNFSLVYNPLPLNHFAGVWVYCNQKLYSYFKKINKKIIIILPWYCLTNMVFFAKNWSGGVNYALTALSKWFPNTTLCGTHHTADVPKKLLAAYRYSHIFHVMVSSLEQQMLNYGVIFQIHQFFLYLLMMIMTVIMMTMNFFVVWLTNKSRIVFSSCDHC